MRRLTLRSTLWIGAIALIGVMPSTVQAQAETGRWSLDVQAAVFNPVGLDGSIGGAKVDYLGATVPQVEVGVQVSERFRMGLSVMLANIDVQGGDPAVTLGDVDMSLFQLSGTYHAWTLGETAISLGGVIARAGFEDIDITPAANSFGVTRGRVGDATLYGFIVRTDTPFGQSGDWYFTSQLRYLLGGPDMVISTSSTTLSGGTDLNPLIVSLGVGFRY